MAMNDDKLPDGEMSDLDEMFEKYNALAQLRDERNADIFVVSGNMQRKLADDVINQLSRMHDKKANSIVFLCTYGGDPNAAYIIARAFKRHYHHFSVYISGYCKSAGTLLVLGADEVVMAEKGELGPLDVQLNREDDLSDYLSGLDIASSINKLGTEAFAIFEDALIRIISSSGGSITTKTAADIAVQLSTGIISPIAAQLDVLKFVESARSMDIAIHYGRRLGADMATVVHLVAQYPSHSFVIDFEEAYELFPNVRRFEAVEVIAELQVQYILMKSEAQECIRTPHERGIVVVLNMNTEENTIPEDVDRREEEQGDRGNANDEDS
jgi:hypothetical protein